MWKKINVDFAGKQSIPDCLKLSKAFSDLKYRVRQRLIILLSHLLWCMSRLELQFCNLDSSKILKFSWVPVFFFFGFVMFSLQFHCFQNFCIFFFGVLIWSLVSGSFFYRAFYGTFQPSSTDSTEVIFRVPGLENIFFTCLRTKSFIYLLFITNKLLFLTYCRLYCYMYIL